MSINFKSWRIRDTKAKLERMTLSTPMLFTKQIALLESLMSIETISLRNARWARRYLVERMRPIYLDQGTIDIMNRFEARFESAEQRRIRRREKKLAEKAAGRAPGNSVVVPKGAPDSVAPAAEPVPPSDLLKLWESMIEENNK